MRTQLIIVAGLKAAGKTTLAEAIAQRERIPYFAFDKLRKELLPTTFQNVFASKDDIHTLALNLVADQLRLGLSVVFEGEFLTDDIRHRFSDVATAHGAEFCPIHITVGDDAVWQRRIITTIEAADRDATFTGWHELLAMRRVYVPWPDGTLIVDSALSLDDNYAAVQAYLASTHHQPYPSPPE